MGLKAAMAAGGIIAFAALAQADRTVKFVNHCPYNLTYWAVGPLGSNMAGIDYQGITVPAHGNSTHGMVNTEGWGAGLALKVRDLPYYQVAPAGIIQVEYYLQPSNEQIWYDLSRIDCSPNADPMDPYFCPLIAGGIKLSIRDQDPTPDCPHAACMADGSCHNVYTKHGTWWGEPSFHCHLNIDIEVETCTEGVGPQTFDHRAPKPEDDKPSEPKPVEPTRTSVSTRPMPVEPVPTEAESPIRSTVLSRPVEPITVYSTVLKPTTIWNTLMKTITVHHTHEASPPVYSALGETTDVYSPPRFSTPIYSAPIESTPEVPAPDYTAVYSSPTWPTPVYAAPEYSAPVESPWLYSEPTYPAPTSVYSVPPEPTREYSIPIDFTPEYSSPVYFPPIEPSAVYSPPGENTPIYSSPVYPIPPASTPVYSAPVYSAPINPLVVSPDGTCGGSTGYTCKGNPGGQCCSEWGYCGASEDYCNAKSQLEFGLGKQDNTAPEYTAPISISPNGSCGEKAGFTCANSAFGHCCSKRGFCGDSAKHCDVGCQSAFGICHGVYGRDAAPELIVPRRKKLNINKVIVSQDIDPNVRGCVTDQHL